MGSVKVAENMFDSFFSKLKVSDGEVALHIAKNNMKSLGHTIKDGVMSEAAEKTKKEYIENLAEHLSRRDAVQNKINLSELAEDAAAERKNRFIAAAEKKYRHDTSKYREIIEAKGIINDEQKKFLKYGSSIADDGNIVTGEENMLGDIAYGLKTAKNYMTEPGKAGARWTAYAGVMVGGRVISGGTPLHNNTGERDIAGLPFF